MSNEQYGMPDILPLMAGRNYVLPAMSQTPMVVESFPVHHHRGLTVVTPHHYERLGSSTSGGVLCTTASAVDFNYRNDSRVPSNTSMCGLELESGFGMGSEIGGNGRWPRQETLTLLEIRSRLDLKFKEANQKGPLWDEVSRIMAEENGYQRSGKKCREKFENLYKYYKKTKEGKAGRQDGKHYRFFRQLEAIYGGSNNLNQPTCVQETNLTSYNNNMSPLAPYNNCHEMGDHDEVREHKVSESLTFSNNDSLETSSSENNKDDQDLSAIAFMMKKRVERKSGNGKEKVKEFIEMEMRKVMETQEEWMERMLKSIEVREMERACKEEEWRKQEEARLDREHKFWAKERAWLEARDVALMEALKKVAASSHTNAAMFCDNNSNDNFMARSETNKKLKEDTRTYNYFQQLDLYQDHHHHSQQGRLHGLEGENENQIVLTRVQQENNVVVSSSSVGFEEMWWDKYGLKLSNDKYQQG